MVAAKCSDLGIILWCSNLRLYPDRRLYSNRCGFRKYGNMAKHKRRVLRATMRGVRRRPIRLDPDDYSGKIQGMKPPTIGSRVPQGVGSADP